MTYGNGTEMNGSITEVKPLIPPGVYFRNATLAVGEAVRNAEPRGIAWLVSGAKLGKNQGIWPIKPERHPICGATNEVKR